MADTRSSIFNQRATEKLRSPDDLDKYVRVTNPSVWVLLMACLALIGGMLAWGVFGSVDTNLRDMGVRVGDRVLCFLDADQVSKVSIGDVAVVGGEQMRIASVGNIPESVDEISAVLGSDYLVAQLVGGEWAYVVEFEGDNDLVPGIPLEVNITTERIPPISLILG